MNFACLAPWSTLGRPISFAYYIMPTWCRVYGRIGRHDIIETSFFWYTKNASAPHAQWFDFPFRYAPFYQGQLKFNMVSLWPPCVDRWLIIYRNSHVGKLSTGDWTRGLYGSHWVEERQSDQHLEPDEIHASWRWNQELISYFRILAAEANL